VRADAAGLPADHDIDDDVHGLDQLDIHDHHGVDHHDSPQAVLPRKLLGHRVPAVP
jgi:hypothetical protein